MRSLFIPLVFLLITSCKNDKQTTVADTEAPAIEKAQTIPLEEGEERFKGDFIFSADAAVLTTRNEIYAVALNDKMYELDKAAKALKETQYDMVNVVVHGIKKPNPLRLETGEGWEHMITITKIIELAPASSINVIKTGNKN
jgi:hypothetical protein